MNHVRKIKWFCLNTHRSEISATAFRINFTEGKPIPLSSSWGVRICRQTLTVFPSHVFWNIFPSAGEWAVCPPLKLSSSMWWEIMFYAGIRLHIEIFGKAIAHFCLPILFSFYEGGGYGGDKPWDRSPRVCKTNFRWCIGQ